MNSSVCSNLVEPKMAAITSCSAHFANIVLLSKLSVLKILRGNASVLCDTCEHSRSDFLAVVKSKDNVRPAFTGKCPV